MQNKPKILIVDDRKDNLVALRTTLSEVDAEVIEATNGNDALTATLNHLFALAILDVQMPGMDGYELAGYIHSDSSIDKFPIIFLTANLTDEDKVSKGYETGAVDYLVKPYDPFVLLSKVSVFITLHRQKLEIKNYSEHLEELVLERTIKLDEAVKDLIKSNSELEQFARIAAHDLQEPLRRVSSYSQFLEKKYREKLDNEADEIIEYIVKGTRDLQDMIIGLHDFIEIKSNNSDFGMADLSHTLEKCKKQLKREITDSKAVIRSNNLPIVHGDEKQLVRLFNILIQNSIKFRSEDYPEVQIFSMEENGCWQISIKDNGIGIDIRYHDIIFQIFKTLHPKNKYGGNGIGLSIAKRIVENHGGRLWVENGPERGTSLVFTIKKPNTDVR
jgi:two-component system sensor histidine kinase/response regulator